jgi:hypothetical protein
MLYSHKKTAETPQASVAGLSKVEYSLEGHCPGWGGGFCTFQGCHLDVILSVGKQGVDAVPLDRVSGS